MAIIHDLSLPDVSLPNLLLFDASVLLELIPLFADAKPERNRRVLRFIKQVQEARWRGECHPLVSIQSLIECYHKILWKCYDRDPKLGKRRDAIAHKKEISKGRVTWRHLYKDSPQAIRRYYPEIVTFHQAIITLPIHVVEPEDLADSSSDTSPLEERVRHYVNSHYLWTNDAYLVAIAERLGVYHIATLDRDFDGLKNRFTLYTIPETQG